MCNLLFSSKYPNQDKLQESLNLGFHRGPDHQEFIIRDDMYFGHSRLSILDLSRKADQPMEKKGVTLLFNGEIYNYKDLVKLYDFHPKSSGDTEVILDLYLLKGKESFKELDGEFAIVIYDSRDRRVYMVRDSFGIKPLYYSKNDNNGMIIASEIKPILHLLGSKPEINRNAFNRFLRYGYTFGSETLFKGIKKCDPGTIYSFKTWGNIIDGEGSIDWPESHTLRREEIKLLIKKSILDKTLSDVPISVCLSGGIDSSIITKYVSEVNPKLRTYTLGFKEDKEQVDLRNARIVSKYFKTDHTEVIISVEDALKEIENIVREMEEPMDKGSVIPTYFLSKIIKEKVTLVGEGADELFAGYKRHEDIVENFPRNENEYVRKYLEIFPILQDSRGIMFKPKNGNDYLRYDLVTEIPDYHTNRLDKLFMNRSIECRVPFLNKALVSAALSIPYQEKIPNKRYLRNLFKNDLPREVIEVKKNAFKIPYGEWVYKKEIKDNLYSSDSYFKKEMVDSVYYELPGTRNKERRIWLMYLVNVWIKIFFKDKSNG